MFRRPSGGPSWDRRRGDLLRRFIGAVLVFRLELHQFPMDTDLLLALWRRTPVIELVLGRRSGPQREGLRWRQRLDEVYPF